MKIKSHPRVFVELFVDGRYEILVPKTVTNYKDAFKVAALKMYIPKALEQMAGTLETDRYEAFLSNYSILKRTFEIDLKPV